jgi:hypothetical protein
MDEQSRMYGQENISLPHDVVPLPSEGIFYKNKKKSIKVGYLTAYDENIIMAGGDNLAINLLRNKIYEPDMKVEDMLEGDVESVLIFLRNTAFGPDMMITTTDPKTGKQFQVNVTLDQMSILKGQEPTSDGHFVTTLPKTGSTVKLKPLTYGEIREISKTIDSYPQGRVAPYVTLKLQRQIVEVNGTQDKGEIAKFVEQLPIADSKYIKKFMNDNEPKLDMSKIVTTPSGEKLTVNVGFGVDFFRPFF